jgi:hypothetical protein
MGRTRIAALLLSLTVAMGMLAAPGQAADPRGTTVPVPQLSDPP